MSDYVWPHRWQPTRLCHPWDSPGKNTGVGCHFLLQCMKVKSESEVAQSCPTLSDLMDCSPQGSSVHGIFQARVLEWGAIAFSKHRILCSNKNEQTTNTTKLTNLSKRNRYKWVWYKVHCWVVTSTKLRMSVCLTLHLRQLICIPLVPAWKYSLYSSIYVKL